MKQIITLFLTFTLLVPVVRAQFSLGLRVGMHSSAQEVGSAVMAQDWASLKVRENLGFRGGLLLRIKLGPVYFQPEALLTTTQARYSLEDLKQPGQLAFRDERYLHLDLPMLVGVKLSFLRIQAGPVASLLVEGASDFESMDDLKRSFDQAQWSLQAGLGIDIWRLMLDVNYQHPLDKGREGIQIAGQGYSLSQAKGQLVLGLGFKL